MQKIKEHFKRNKQNYLIGTGVVVGGAALFLGGGYLGACYGAKQRVTAQQLIAYKSPITQNIIQQLSIPRAGHAGKVLVDDETGEVFTSVKKMADSLGTSRRMIQRYLSGETPDILGKTYTLLADGAPDLIATQTLAA